MPIYIGEKLTISKDKIKYVIISHNFAGYNGDDYYEIDINDIEDIQYAKKEKERIAERDRCIGTDSYFVCNDKQIRENQVKEILKKSDS